MAVDGRRQRLASGQAFVFVSLRFDVGRPLARSLLADSLARPPTNGYKCLRCAAGIRIQRGAATVAGILRDHGLIPDFKPMLQAANGQNNSLGTVSSVSYRADEAAR